MSIKMSGRFRLFTNRSQEQSVLRSIKNRRWRIIREKLHSGKLASSVDDIMNIENSGQSLLHAVCKKNPPEDIVQMIVDAFPDTVFQVNQSNQYPIHIAAQCGASPKVIQQLCNFNPEASCRCDSAGKTPLHLACEHYASSYKSVSKSLTIEEAMFETIVELTQKALCVVHLEDEEGKTALEHAIDTGTDIMIIERLQYDCERWLREQKAVRSINQKRLL